MHRLFGNSDGKALFESQVLFWTNQNCGGKSVRVRVRVRVSNEQRIE
jgi:hypothetical protein